MRCENCGGKHRRIPTERLLDSARFCQKCGYNHSVHEVWPTKLHFCLELISATEVDAFFSRYMCLFDVLPPSKGLGLTNSFP